MKKHVQSAIMLGSETAWVYYIIFLFTSAERNQATSYPVIGLLLAGIIGYSINNLLISRFSQQVIFTMNAMVLILLLFYHRTNILTDSTTGLLVAVSIGMAGLYMQGARLVLQAPRRRDVLVHFEGNLVLYTVLAATFSVNEWPASWFHLIFLSAIISSLLSMVLTLHYQTETEENTTVKTIRVGNSGWFLWSISSIFIVIPLLAAFLLVPGVNQSFRSGGLQLWRLITGLGQTMLSILIWLMSLIPHSPEGELLEGSPQASPEPTSLDEILNVHIPILEIGAGLILAAALAILWMLSRKISLKNVKKPHSHQAMPVERDSLWKRSLAFFHSRLERLLRKIRLQFRFNYRHPAFWYFQKVQEWGRKNKIHRKPAETSSEFLRRLASTIPEKDSTFNLHDIEYNLKDSLEMLEKDFQEAYYGMKEETGEISDQQYDAMLKKLKQQTG